MNDRITIHDVADRLGIHWKDVLRLAKADRLGYIRSSYWVYTHEFESFLEETGA